MMVAGMVIALTEGNVTTASGPAVLIVMAMQGCSLSAHFLSINSSIEGFDTFGILLALQWSVRHHGNFTLV